MADTKEKEKDKEKAKKKDPKKRKVINSSASTAIPRSPSLNVVGPLPSPLPSSRTKRTARYDIRESVTEYETLFPSSIPDSDISYVTQKRIHRTVAPNIPADVLKQKPPPHVRDCLDVYAKDWKVCVFESRNQFGKGSVAGLSQDDLELCPLKFDDPPAEGEESSTPISIDQTLLTSRQDDQSIDDIIDKVNEERYNIFRLSGFNTLRQSDLRPEALPMYDTTGLQVMLEMKEFKMAVEDVDVFYGSVALYNLSEKPQSRGRLSEFFHFTLTDSSRWGRETDFRPGPISRESLARQAIFNVEKPGPDICLLFRFEKILWGDVAHATDFYANSSIKPKEYMKLRNEGQEKAERFGKYSQSFVCAALQLFPPDGPAVVGKERSVENTITNLIRMNNGDLSDESIYLEVRTLLKKSGQDDKGILSNRSRRIRPLPGKIVLQLKQVHPDDQIPNRVTPSLIPISPFVSSTTKVIREIQAFTHQDEGTPSPFLSYFHHLYVYPETVNFSRYEGKCSARNICCEIQLKVNDVDETPPGLPIIAGRAVMSNFVSSAITSVIYHEQRPHFFEEIRFSLPTDLIPNHHLLFTFKHIALASSASKGKKKEGKDSLEEIAGYAWIRILDSHNNLLPDKEYDLPVAIELPQRYLSADPSSVKWVDGQKEVFTMRSKLVSSIIPRDSILAQYFVQFNQSSSQKEWMSFVNSAKSIRMSNRRDLVHFLPVLLNQLFRIIATEKDDIGLECLYSIAHIIEQTNMIDEEGDKEISFRHPLLTSYISTMFESIDLPEISEHLHLKLLRLWTRRLTVEAANDALDQTFLRFIWFMFDIVIKSRIQYLHDRKLWPFRPNGNSSESNVDDDKQFGHVVTSLVKGLLASEIQPTLLGKSLVVIRKQVSAPADRSESSMVGHQNNDMKKKIALVLHVNEQLALFIKDLIPLLSSETLIELILTYTEKIDLNHPNSKLTVAKFEFIRIIIDCEHYIPINRIPKVPYVIDPQHMMETARTRHVLSSLVIEETLLVIQTTQGEARSDARSCALALLTHLLLKHSCDSRYNRKEIQRSIASIYFPFVVGLIEEERKTNVFTMSVATKMCEEDLHQILLAFLWIIRTVGAEYLRSWLLKDHDSNLKFFQILWKALDSFDPGHKTRGEAFLNVRPSESAAADMKTKELADDYGLMAMGVLKGREEESISASKESAATPLKGPLRKFRKLQAATEKKITPEAEAHLHREVTLIVIESVWYMLADHRDQVHIICKFLVALLRQTHSEQVLDHLFVCVGHFISLFTDILFVQRNSYCEDITYELMKYCNSYSAHVRGQAAALLYSMFVKAWKCSGHLVRMKLQCSAAIAKLVADVRSRGASYLSSSLKAIARHASLDSDVSSDFKGQLDDLLDKRMSDILTNVSLLQRWESDPEMFADILYQISCGWRDSPDIRFHWMEALAARHIADANLEESAQCRIHTAALIISHLEALKPDTTSIFSNPMGRHVLYRALTLAAPNCVIEFHVDCSPATALNEGMCCSDTFTDKGFEKALSLSAKDLEKVHLYETAIEVQRLVGVSLNMRREWKEMAEVYTLAAAWASNIDSDVSATRSFSSYFRVMLIGQQYELKNQSFIYKEKGTTRVTDMTSRLMSQFVEIFGEDKVVQLPTKWTGDPSELDKGKAYFLVSEVSPYFTEEDLLHRPTPYERQTNIHRFIFETPYSVDPKKKISDVRAQGKIKTILTTSHSFPFVLKRIPVIDEEKRQLTPIQAHIEDLSDRIQKLRSEVEAAYPNANNLQSTFLMYALNQGNNAFPPLEVCRAFVGEGETDEHRTLKNLFESFLAEGDRALTLYAEIIKSDKIESHKEMEDAFAEVRKQILSVIQLKGSTMVWVRASSSS
jgi:hypothetical protein